MGEHARVSVLPMDEHNEKLVHHVHPPDWRNPDPARKYHLVVLGAGTAGLVTAAGAAGLGAKVALVERHLMGGDCLNVGCVPSKCVLRSARVAAEFRDAAQFGLRLRNEPEVDFPAVMERMRRLRAQISHVDSARRFREEYGVDVFLGEAKFSGRNIVQVGGAELRFSRAVIATGARAMRPPIDGIEDTGYLTNESVFSLTERPARLAVIGAGPIGCELAQAFQNLGSQVTVVELAPQILGKEDRDAATILEAQMRADGVEFATGAEVKRAWKDGQDKVLLLEAGGEEQELRVDEILVGVGRQPNVEGLNLEAAGVDYDPRLGVTVSDYLQTSNPAVYAAGDVCMAWKFTHAADFAARIAIRNALFSLGPFGRAKLSSLTMPWCTYTHPEVAHVGLSEREASDRGIAIDTFVQEFEHVDRAIADGDTEGFAKIHVRRGSDEIMGATIVARNAGDMISEVTLAMENGIGLGAIANVIHPYPTQAEAIRKLGDQYNRTRVTPAVKRWMQRYLNWRF